MSEKMKKSDKVKMSSRPKNDRLNKEADMESGQHALSCASGYGKLRKKRRKA